MLTFKTEKFKYLPTTAIIQETHTQIPGQLAENNYN